MIEPNGRVRLIQDQDLPIVRSLWEAYLIELATYDEGVEAGMQLQEAWWTKPGELHGFVLLADERPVGFLLVMGKRWAKAIGETTDYHVYEMFLTPEVRGTGLASDCARTVFDSRPGSWSLHVAASNARALGFWRRVLAVRAYKAVESGLEHGKISMSFRVSESAEPRDD